MGKLPKIYLFVVTVADIAHLHVGLSPAVELAINDLKNRVLALADEILVTC
jgi:hypothetical protein